MRLLRSNTERKSRESNNTIGKGFENLEERRLLAADLGALVEYAPVSAHMGRADAVVETGLKDTASFVLSSKGRDQGADAINHDAAGVGPVLRPAIQRESTAADRTAGVSRFVFNAAIGTPVIPAAHDAADTVGPVAKKDDDSEEEEDDDKTVEEGLADFESICTLDGGTPSSSIDDGYGPDAYTFACTYPDYIWGCNNHSADANGNPIDECWHTRDTTSPLADIGRFGDAIQSTEVYEEHSDDPIIVNAFEISKFSDPVVLSPPVREPVVVAAPLGIQDGFVRRTVDMTTVEQRDRNDDRTDDRADVIPVLKDFGGNDQATVRKTSDASSPVVTPVRVLPGTPVQPVITTRTSAATVARGGDALKRTLGRAQADKRLSNLAVDNALVQFQPNYGLRRAGSRLLRTGRSR